MGSDLTLRYRAIQGNVGTVHVDPEFAPEIESLGLLDFGHAMNFSGGDPVGANSRRSVVRVHHSGRSWFLKRFGPPKASEVLRAVLSLRSLESPAHTEARMALEFETAGLVSYRVAAFGESAGPQRLRSSFLLTAGIESACDLFDIALSGSSKQDWAKRKKSMLPGLATAVRRMHDAGITHPDLYSYHVFALGEDAAEGFAFIDLHRAAKLGSVGMARAASDLAGLRLTFPPASIRRADVVLFLKAYCGVERLDEQARKLARLVAARAGKIGHRRRFREIADGRFVIRT